MPRAAFPAVEGGGWAFLSPYLLDAGNCMANQIGRALPKG
jgi:hypothetical protein